VTSSRAEAPGTGQPGALGSSAPRDTATWAVAAAVGVFPLLLRWTSGGGAAELAVLAPGLAGLVCLSVLLSGIVSRSGAAWASILLLYASSLYGPWTSATEAGPTVGFLLATGVLTVWWGGHAHLSLLRACVLGALIGAAAVAQGLSSLLIALPVVSLSLEPEGRRRSAATRVLVTLACFALVAAPSATPIPGSSGQPARNIAVSTSPGSRQTAVTPEPSRRRARANVSSVIASFDDLGSYGLLLGLQDTLSLEVFYDSVLGKLQEYDRQNSSDLVKSLACFLEANGHWGDAAEKLYVHRHTLRYRMKRVEEITGRDLNQSQDRMEFWLALKAKELIDQSKKGKPTSA